MKTGQLLLSYSEEQNKEKNEEKWNEKRGEPQGRVRHHQVNQHTNNGRLREDKRQKWEERIFEEKVA